MALLVYLHAIETLHCVFHTSTRQVTDEEVITWWHTVTRIRHMHKTQRGQTGSSSSASGLPLSAARAHFEPHRWCCVKSCHSRGETQQHWHPEQVVASLVASLLYDFSKKKKNTFQIKKTAETPKQLPYRLSLPKFEAHLWLPGDKASTPTARTAAWCYCTGLCMGRTQRQHSQLLLHIPKSPDRKTHCSSGKAK